MVEQSAATLDSVFHALSDATRRAILRDLSRAEKTVGDLARPYAMSLAAVSKHVQVLERAQLVERQRRGQFQVVRMKPKTLRAAQDWLTFYENFWSARLDEMQALLETQPGQAGEPAERENQNA